MIPGIMAGQMLAPVAPAGGLAWNSADKAGYTLENSSLDVRNRSAGEIDNLARSTPTKTSGKWYFECSMLEATIGGGIPLRNDRVGVGIASTTTSSTSYLGQSGVAIGFWNKGNIYRSSGSGVDSEVTARQITLESDIIGIAFDCGTGGYWFRKNGTWVGGDPDTDPALGAIDIGYTYAVAATPEDPAYGARLRSALTYSLPAGFSKWE